jgi:DNA uptake protein ComE-like DNA-binding protein
VNLNVATFEELRAIGLSVTESSRVIAYRDVRGGYESFDEFEGIPGLSSETLSQLRARAQL